MHDHVPPGTGCASRGNSKVTAGAPDLRGVRVLVVEDSLLIAESIADLLEAAGASVVGPMGQIASGLAAAQEERLDGALLDVNLAGENVGPIAEALRARDIPFIFLTGYSDAAALPPGFREVPRLVKPFQEHALTTAIAARFRPAGRRAEESVSK